MVKSAPIIAVILSRARAIDITSSNFSSLPVSFAFDISFTIDKFSPKELNC